MEKRVAIGAALEDKRLQANATGTSIVSVVTVLLPIGQEEQS